MLISSLIFLVGLISILFRSNNLIIVFLGLELIFLGLACFSIQYSYIMDDIIGINIAIYILPIAGTESAILLAILVKYSQSSSSILFN